MAKESIQNVEPVDGNKTRYTVFVPTKTGGNVVVVIMGAGHEVVAVSPDAGMRAGERAVEAVYRYIHGD